MLGLGKLGIMHFQRRGSSLVLPEGFVLVEAWTHSTNVAEKDFLNLGAYQELLVHFHNILTTTVSRPAIRVSSNNGSSFLAASGDYQEVGANGSETAETLIDTETATVTTVRSAIVHFLNFNMTIPKFAVNDITTLNLKVIPSASAMNAIRCSPFTGLISGGSINVFGRQ